MPANFRISGSADAEPRCHQACPHARKLLMREVGDVVEEFPQLIRCGLGMDVIADDLIYPFCYRSCHGIGSTIESRFLGCRSFFGIGFLLFPDGFKFIGRIFPPRLALHGLDDGVIVTSSLKHFFDGLRIQRSRLLNQFRGSVDNIFAKTLQSF